MSDDMTCINEPSSPDEPVVSSAQSDGPTHEKKPVYKKWWFWAIALFIIAGLFGAFDDTTPTADPDEAAAEVAVEDEAPQTEPAAEVAVEDEAPGPSYPDGELSVSSIESVIDADSVATDTDGRVTITMHPTDVWSENTLVRGFANDAVEIMEVIFTHPDVSAVEVEQQMSFTDEYGQSSVDSAVKIIYSRETADKIDWDNFPDLVLVDHKRAFQIADYYYIHPGIWRNLKDTEGLPVEGFR